MGYVRIGEDVLIIGMGASGLDLMLQLRNVAKFVAISRKSTPYLAKDTSLKQQQTILPPKTSLKDGVERFTMDGAEFVDGSRQSFTTIIYATGAFKNEIKKKSRALFSTNSIFWGCFHTHTQYTYRL